MFERRSEVDDCSYGDICCCLGETSVGMFLFICSDFASWEKPLASWWGSISSFDKKGLILSLWKITCFCEG